MCAFLVNGALSNERFAPVPWGVHSTSAKRAKLNKKREARKPMAIRDIVPVPFTHDFPKMMAQTWPAHNKRTVPEL